MLEVGSVGDVIASRHSVATLRWHKAWSHEMLCRVALGRDGMKAWQVQGPEGTSETAMSMWSVPAERQAVKGPERLGDIGS